MAPPAQHPYADFVHRVEKPARYLGGEYGSANKDWAQVRARVCLAFPDIYDIGMSHLGFKILYKILNDDPRTLAERAYAPWVDMERELRARDLPLVSLESARPLRDFDVVGFSLQFELTFSNILLMLDLGGIPLRSEDRRDEDPLVIAGGPTATHPEPIAAFVDAIVIGDGEERATDLALMWAELRDAGVPRGDRLAAIAALPGVYVPSLYTTVVDADSGFEVVDRPTVAGLPFPIQRNLIADLNRYPFPSDGPVGGPEAIFDRMSIEIARGCTEGCRFCQAGMIYRPVRERDPDQIVETLVAAVKQSGYDEVSLTSLSTADYSCIAPLIEKVTARLAPEHVSLGVSSLRAYGLEENVLDDLRRVRASGVTFAPEAGSQRMRDVVNKNVTEEQLMTTAERIFSRGWDSMKLYFMIGLPTEEEVDVREIVGVGKRAREVGRRIRKERGAAPPKVTVSVSTHVPKPHTPFQWCAMDAPETVRGKQRWLLDEAKQAKGVDLRMHNCETSWLEAVFARGDRKLGRVLERAYRAGCRFDSWEDQLKLQTWTESFAAEGIDPQAYLGTLAVSARLPWDHIDVGLEEGFLLREYRKALKSRLSPPCGKVAGAFVHPSNLEDAERDQRKLVCYDCGVACDLSAIRRERREYLVKLGARSPRVAKPQHEHEPRDVPPNVPRNVPRNVPPRVVQGEARRYRFGFSKIGPMAFLSHLDLIRAVPRSFRRLGVSIFYSSGFHPKPDMTFSPALSLGVGSLAEVLDVKLSQEVDPEQLALDLNRVSPLGLIWNYGLALEARDPVVSKVVDGATYAVGFPRRALDELGGVPRLAEEIARFQATPHVCVTRRYEKGLSKSIDVSRYVTRLSPLDTTAADYLERAGAAGDLVPMLVELDITPHGSAKAAEVVEALLGSEVPFHGVRARLGLRTPSGIVSPAHRGRILEALAMPPSVPSVPSVPARVAAGANL